jgi:diaminopimelate epimerase
MNFTKIQAAGNDFVLVETSDTQRNWSPVAVAMSDRHFGIGGDGLLLMLPSKLADFQMRVFNPDGSEVEACGNGLRCLARYAVDRGLVNSGAQEMSVETVSGIRKARLHRTNGLTEVQVNMGMPKLGLKAEDIPEAAKHRKGSVVDIILKLSYTAHMGNTELLLNLVSMGNPHAVYFSQDPVSDFPLSRLGPEVEHLDIFPNNANFEVARVISRQQIEARVWERGVGETLACGSGACAIAVAAQLHGYIDDKVDIKLPGGILRVEWDGRGEALLSGPAEKVFSGEWPDEV